MACRAGTGQIIKATDLKCNYLTNPIGIDTPAPRLSWALDADGWNRCQTAYRILVATSEELLLEDVGDLWDSGEVSSDKQVHIVYGGKELSSEQRCFWKVCVWDEEGEASPWSEHAFFEMGLLNEEDWKAKWIGDKEGENRFVMTPDVDKPFGSPMFRKKFWLDKKPVRARAYICGVGYYELRMNGGKIGTDVLSPAYTRYDKTVLYATYDVTEILETGENVVGVILGNGRYNSFTAGVWDLRYEPWRHHPKFILQIHIAFENGETMYVLSDKSWKAANSPIVYNCLLNGEHYDARLEQPGWDMKGYHDADWEDVKISASTGGLLKAAQMQPTKVVDVIKPLDMKEVDPGVWIYDFGQNITGWARLKVSGLASTQVKLRYSELLDGNGRLNQGNISGHSASGEFQTDKYILKGDGTEVWEPRFTYHGFRYVELTGYPGMPALDSVNACVVQMDFDAVGHFECSNELFNKIQSCTRWSILANYQGVPTDCPTREKRGWTGDAHLCAEAGLLNFDAAPFFTKWLKDFHDVQRPSGQLPGIIPTGWWGYNWGRGPGWDCALILIPWYVYVYCGDVSILENNYSAMEKYMKFFASMADGYIAEFGLADWLPPNAIENEKCPAAVTDTAYYYIDALTLAKISVILGKEDRAVYYLNLAGKIREAFRTVLFNSSTGIVRDDCQTSYACALYQELINDDEVDMVLGHLIRCIEDADYHVDCGILGTKYILNVLTMLGRTDIAYRMANQTTFPGWGYWISQGATTLWESWGGEFTHNHHMFGDISAWFYKALAGINPDPEEPGFKHIVFKPTPVEDLKWVKARHKSLYGVIECNWRVEGKMFHVELTIPVNCHGTLYLPEGYGKDVTWEPKTEVAEIVATGGKQGSFHLGSGTYKITAVKMD